MEHALFSILALSLNAVLMGPWAVDSPLGDLLRLPAQELRAIERKLNRPQRTLGVRTQRGLLLLVTVLLSALALGLVINQLHIRVLSIAVLALLLPVRPTWDLTSAIGKDLEIKDTATARIELKDSIWRHYALLDEYALARAAIETLAVQFSEKIVAPLFWYLLLGMPGFLLAKAIYLLKETLCLPQASNGFTQPAFLLHSTINFIPSRLAAILWLPMPMFLPSGKSIAAVTHVGSAIASQQTPEQLAVSAAAAVLGLSLGGPTSVYTQGIWCGTGSAKASPADIRHGLYLFALLHLFGIVLLGFCL